MTNSILLIIGFGIVSWAIIALAAVAVTLQIGITNYANLAYGSYMSLAAYVTWEANVHLGLNLWLAMAVSCAVLGLVAVAIHVLLLSPYRRRNPSSLYMLILTLGLWMLLENAMASIWGVDTRRFETVDQPAFAVGPFQLTSNQLLIISVAGVALLAVHLLLTQTEIGKAMRAVSDNRDLALASGIDADRIVSITWFIAGALLALAGNALALSITTFEPFFGDSYLFIVIAAVILGGTGHAYGAMVGAFVVGMVGELSTLVSNSAFKLEAVFLVFLFVLLVRPQGLFASRTRTFGGH